MKFFKSFESFFDPAAPTRKKKIIKPKLKPLPNHELIQNQEYQNEKTQQEIGQRATANIPKNA